MLLTPRRGSLSKTPRNDKLQLTASKRSPALWRDTGPWRTIIFSVASRQTRIFAKSLIALYRAIALFYMKAACYFARSTPFRTVRGLVAADAWGPALESARTAETTCYSLVTLLGWTTSLRKVDEVLKNLSTIEFKDLIRDVEQWLVWDVKVKQQHQAKRPSLALGLSLIHI